MNCIDCYFIFSSIQNSKSIVPIITLSAFILLMALNFGRYVFTISCTSFFEFFLLSSVNILGNSEIDS